MVGDINFPGFYVDNHYTNFMIIVKLIKNFTCFTLRAGANRVDIEVSSHAVVVTTTEENVIYDIVLTWYIGKELVL